MHVFIAGATGVLGRRLVAELDSRGNEVIGLARDDTGERVVREAGGKPVRGDLLAPETIQEAMPDDVDAVVHAATAIPTKTKTTAADWETTDRLRREGTETLTAAAVDAGADRYVQQSVVWVARQPDGSEFDEDSEPHPDRTTEAAVDAERIAERAGAERDLDVAILRGGWFYAHDATHTRQIAARIANRRMAIVGGGLLGRRDAKLSLCHVDDAASAFVAAVEGDATGRYHVVDDTPVTLARFLQRLAAALDAPEPMRVPGWLAKLLVGGDTVRLLTNPMPTTNDRFRSAFDWEPSYPSYHHGIDRLVEQWKVEGTVSRTDGEVVWRE